LDLERSFDTSGELVNFNDVGGEERAEEADEDSASGDQKREVESSSKSASGVGSNTGADSINQVV
jgi:hypothetical protein